MVCYCSRRRVIYIHIPKTGGLTVEKILCSRYGFKKFTFDRGNYDFLNDPRGKLGILRYILMYSEESKKYDLQNFFKFAFIRDPYSRCLSAINYLYDLSEKKKNKFPKDYSTFIRRSRSDVYFYMHFNLTQLESLKDLDGNVNIDFIGRFETLMKDLKHVLFNILKMEYREIDNVHENRSLGVLNISLEDIRDDVDKIHVEDFEFIRNIKKPEEI